MPYARLDTLGLKVSRLLSWLHHRRCRRHCRKPRRPMAEVAMAWLLARPGVTAPILGASKSQHLDDAVAALSLALDEDEIQSLEAD